MSPALNSSPRGRVGILLGICIALIALADFLFYDHPVGWTTGLFTLVLFAALLIRGGRLLRTTSGKAVAAALIGLTVAMTIEPGPLVLVMASLTLVSLAIINAGGWTARAFHWPRSWLIFLCKAAIAPFADARAAQRWSRSRGHRWPWLHVMGGWLLPVMLSLVFVGLFVAANPIIEGWFSSLPSMFQPARFIFWMFVGFAAWGLLRARVLRAPSGDSKLSSALAHLPDHAEPALVMRCLVLFNLIFAVQTAMDIGYLWSGADLPEQYTYAQYAHRGAYPLLITALLAGLFVLATFRAGQQGTPWRWPRRLVIVWIAQNVFLMMSAMFRLQMYIDAYSLSRWRIAAAIWMGLVAIGLLLLIVRIVANFDNRWLVGACTRTTIVVLYVCCFVNFDGLIANYNVRHCLEIRGGQRAPLDLEYLQSLGPESLPALQWASRQSAFDNQLKTQAAEVRQVLETELNQQLADWRGWTWQRHQLSARLSENG